MGTITVTTTVEEDADLAEHVLEMKAKVLLEKVEHEGRLKSMNERLTVLDKELAFIEGKLVQATANNEEQQILTAAKTNRTNERTQLTASIVDVQKQIAVIEGRAAAVTPESLLTATVKSISQAKRAAKLQSIFDAARKQME